MSFINYSSREINCKLVYYGPGLCGKPPISNISMKNEPRSQRQDDLFGNGNGTNSVLRFSPAFTWRFADSRPASTCIPFLVRCSTKPAAA